MISASALPKIRRLSSDVRPLFIDKSREELQEIFETRAPLYEEIATQIITISGKTPEEIIKEIRR